jgi:hypothetical protein
LVPVEIAGGRGCGKLGVMKFCLQILGCVLFAALGIATAAHAETTMPVDQIVQKTLVRAQQSDSMSMPDLDYTRVSVTEELDGDGKVRERNEKTCAVSYRGGISTVSLLEVNGHSPTESDRKKQSENEMNLRQMLGQPKPANGGNHENFLTPELAARFDFKLVGQTKLAGRTTYQVSFEPKTPPLPEHRLVDRLLNRISGIFWIDAEEFELARAEIFLDSEVNVMGGIAGTLKKLTYTLERTRVADGVWFSTLSHGDFEGRKLLASTHIKTTSESVNFRRIAMARPYARQEG